MGVSEHVSSLCAGGAAGEPAPSTAAECLEEVASWSRENLGLDRAPDFWRLLVQQPRFLQTTWAKDRLVLSPGRLDESAKLCIAVAVAAFRQSAYWIAYFTELVRPRAAYDESALVELTASVMHYVSFNTVAHAMMLGAKHEDMNAAGFADR